MLDERLKQLLCSSNEHNTNTLKRIIDGLPPQEQHELIHSTDVDLRGWLHWCAIYRKDVPVASVLRDFGARLDTGDKDGRLPGHFAVLHEAEALLDYYSTIGKEYLDVPDNMGDTQLHLAARQGNAGLGRKLLLNGADVDVRNTKTLDTALHISVGKCDEAFIALLLEFGASTQIANNTGLLPSQLAVINTQSRIARMIDHPEAFGIRRPVVADPNANVRLHLNPGDSLFVKHQDGSSERLDHASDLTVVRRGIPPKVRRPRRIR